MRVRHGALREYLNGALWVLPTISVVIVLALGALLARRNCRHCCFSALRVRGRVVLVPAHILVDWTLSDEDRQLIANKTGATRLGFAVLLRYFRLHGRFPDSSRGLPRAAVGYLAVQVQVPAAALRK